MSIPEKNLTSEAPRISYAQPLYKRTMMVVAALLLVTGFVLAGTLSATATPASTSNHIPSVLNRTALPCGSEPGFCPNSLVALH